MKQLKEAFQHVLKHGEKRIDRTGTGTYSYFGHQMRFDLSGWKLPIGTGKQVSFKNILSELLFFINGLTNNEAMKKDGCNIWNEWEYTLKPGHLKKVTDLYFKMYPNEDKQPALKLVADCKSNHDSARDYLAAFVKEHFSREMLQSVGLEYPGELGPVYGYMWRSWPTTDGRAIDQLATVIKQLKESPFSRRIVVSAWNPEFLPDENENHNVNIENGKQVLPPCHPFFQFYTSKLSYREIGSQLYTDSKEIEDFVIRGSWAEMAGEQDEFISAAKARGAKVLKLSCQLYMRSNDAWLGMFYNVASYSLLTMMIAKEVGMLPGEYIHTTGDLHIYTNHLEQVRKYLELPTYELPTVVFKDGISLFDHSLDTVKLANYKHGPIIRGDVAV